MMRSIGVLRNPEAARLAGASGPAVAPGTSPTMTLTPLRTPLSPTAIVDEYFIENRTRLLEIAAFLDRVDRADSGLAARDFRLRAFNEALQALAGGQPDRLMQIQMLLSDPSLEPLAALDRKSAQGAYDPASGGRR
jgi:hypothetical protein